MVVLPITLPSNDDKIYLQILMFLNFALDLTTQERQVLSELIKLNHEYEALSPEKRAKFILSTDMRKETREKLGMEEGSFNGVISRLKKKTYFGQSILSENNVINENLLFKTGTDGFEIRIKLLKQNDPIVQPHNEEPTTRREDTPSDIEIADTRIQESIHAQDESGGN